MSDTNYVNKCIMGIRYLASLRSSRMEAKDVAVVNGIPATGFREEAALLRQHLKMCHD